MTTFPTPVWRAALRLLSIRLVLAHLGLAALVFASFVVWLRMPDASAWEVAASGLLAVLVVIGAGFGESWLILNLACRTRKSSTAARGALWFLAGTILWLLWSTSIARLLEHDALLAGYLNSKTPHQLRHLFNYEHILLSLRWLAISIRWLGAGLLASTIFPLVAAAPPLRAGLLAARSVSYWLTLVFGTTVATFLTDALMAWTPGNGLRAEAFSLVARLLVAVLFDTLVACLLLAILAVCVCRADPAYMASSGGPDESQPRTVDIP